MSDLVPLPDSEPSRSTSQEIDQPLRPSMVVVSLTRALPFEVTIDWLKTNLSGLARGQIQDASLVITTDPNARLAHVLKNEAVQGDFLEMHTAAIG